MGIKNKLLTGAAILVVILGLLVAVPTGFTSVVGTVAIAVVLLGIVVMNVFKSKI